jgi:ribosomal protein S18 acetylase RimI-like enzyme
MRQARPSDMYPCAKVFLHAVNDLGRRTGSPPTPRNLKVVAHRLGHLQATDPSGFHVAERGGRVAAFATTILREKVHFLSMFWALPSLQSKGVGQGLLHRAFERPRPPPGTLRCVFASLDFRAQRLYTKFGMTPRTLIYGLGADQVTLPKAPLTPVELEQVGEPGQATDEALALAAAIDRRVRGCRRDADIRFTLSEKGTRFFEAKEDGDTVGYLVVMADGLVGMGGVIDRRYNEGLAWAGLRAVQELRPKRIRMSVPALNREAVELAFRSGMKLTFMGAWMTEREFGKLDCYLATAGDVF